MAIVFWSIWKETEIFIFEVNPPVAIFGIKLSDMNDISISENLYWVPFLFPFPYTLQIFLFYFSSKFLLFYDLKIISK